MSSGYGYPLQRMVILNFPNSEIMFLEVGPREEVENPNVMMYTPFACCDDRKGMASVIFTVIYDFRFVLLSLPSKGIEEVRKG